MFSVYCIAIFTLTVARPWPIMLKFLPFTIILIKQTPLLEVIYTLACMLLFVQLECTIR